MRLAALFGAGLVCLALSTPVHAGGIRTGQDLVTECKGFLTLASAQDSNAVRAPHPCRSFLQGYFISLKAREDARQESSVRGIPYTTKEACVRVPDFLSFREMAERVIRYASVNPRVLNEPAAALAQKTMERDFPCPASR